MSSFFEFMGFVLCSFLAAGFILSYVYLLDSARVHYKDIKRLFDLYNKKGK